MNPYLSIVLCGSNEGYGGNFLSRMQNCVDSILGGAARHGVDMELVLVEWGPPADRPRLTQAIDWSKATVPVRVIEVPKALIATIPNPHHIRFFEPWAKSVGVRRAEGEFVLTTNADSVYSDEMMKFFSLKQLNPKKFYRVNRVDTRNGVPYEIFYANGTFPVGTNVIGKSKTGVPYHENMLHFNASGEFILMSREMYHVIHGWPELTYWSSVDGQTVWLAVTHGLTQEVLPYQIFHEDHARSGSFNPGWEDWKPFAEKNGHGWGFRNCKFAETLIRGPQ